MSESLRVAFALGLGDTYWACTKLRALKARTGRSLHGCINTSENHQSVNLLALIPYLDTWEQTATAPYDITREFSPDYRDPHWSTLEGCAGWNGFDYALVPNGHLERGEPLATWLPELETEYNIPLRISAGAYDRMWYLQGGRPRTLLYLSGRGPNQGFHRDTWTVSHWAQVVQQLNARGDIPILVGANTRDDLGTNRAFIRAARHLQYENLVGATSTEEYLALIETCAVWVGLNSGGGIIGASRETPTVMLWSDSAFPIAGVEPPLPLHTNMKASWLPQDAPWYRTLSFGSPALTPEAVVAAIQEVRRAA